MQRLKKAPKEVRERIFECIVMPWAPLDQYPVTETPYDSSVSLITTSVCLARRNKTPLFADEGIKMKCLQAERPKLKKQAAKDPLYDRGEAMAVFHSTDGLRGIFNNQLTRTDFYGTTTFGDKCGFLDYFKKSEHQSIIEFVKALEQRYETADKMTKHHSYGGKEDTREGFVDLLDDFLTWFWHSTVLDLKDSWALQKRKPPTWNTKLDVIADVWRSRTWLELRPKCHDYIRHISLVFRLHSEDNLGLFFFSLAKYGDFEHPDSVVSLTSTLKNLKCVLLFLDATPMPVKHLLKDGNSEIPRAFRNISASERFEVRWMVRWASKQLFVPGQRQRKREEKHLKTEQSLEMLLMPEALWEKEQSSVVALGMIGTEETGFDFNTVASPGWLTLEGAHGVEHEVHNFLHVQ